MSRTSVPEPWASRMVQLRLVDPRFDYDVPSMSALASRADLHTSTVSSVIHGRRKASTETAAALARVLGPEAQEWLGITVELGPYRPPIESSMLSGRQRRALTELIRSMVSDGRDDDPEPRDRVDEAGQRHETSSSAEVDDPWHGKSPWQSYDDTRATADRTDEG